MTDSSPGLVAPLPSRVCARAGCDRPLPPYTGTGRPPAYCSPEPDSDDPVCRRGCKEENRRRERQEADRLAREGLAVRRPQLFRAGTTPTLDEVAAVVGRTAEALGGQAAALLDAVEVFRVRAEMLDEQAVEQRLTEARAQASASAAEAEQRGATALTQARA
ncbi:MAG: hypothetical protein ACRDYU_15635, partial [Actinomycetes bacterium]